MKPALPICLIVLLASAVPVLADGTVTLSLTSPDAGEAVPAGQAIMWAITATVSGGDNLGLAMVSVDLVQDGGNPEMFDLPPATGVPDGMEGFDRPAGISNPGPDGSGSGYGGTPIGPDGAKNLAQIAGAQNTFGAAGDGIGMDVEVDPGVGQNPGGQIVATGSFPAPAMFGVYAFTMESGAANVLEAINPAPGWSPVRSAVVVLDNAGFSFTVCRPGDVNGDFALTVDQDLPLFVDVLLGLDTGDGYARCAADVNGDGAVDGKDILSFVDALLQG